MRKLKAVIATKCNVRSSRSTSKSAMKHPDFPIVAIGSSAGGLDALSEILQSLRIDTNMAFIIIQHLAPNHQSLSTEILAKSTKMPVLEIKDKIKILKNCVYVMPPNHDLLILKNNLKLSPRTTSLGQARPIDRFFASLAKEKGSQAVGVVLSGMANDGTQGLRALKAAGAISFAQDPKTAKFSAMPSNAILAGAVDFVLTAKKIGIALGKIKFGRTTKAVTLKKEKSANEEDSELAEILHLLYKFTGSDFSLYKTATIKRRIARRQLELNLNTYGKYAEYLKRNEIEANALFADVLIHVTDFFRDPKTFKVLRERYFPELLKNRDKKLAIRIWVAGCATGEEAYSIAISLVEYLEFVKEQASIQIFATDISQSAIQKARAAIFSEARLQNISGDQKNKYFEKVDGGYRVVKRIREICLFSKHDILTDPPFAKLDFISCRNLLIYFGPDLQKRVVPIFHFALRRQGILLLGRSETINGFTTLFDLRDKESKIYFKKEAITPPIFNFGTKNLQNVKMEIMPKAVKAGSLIEQIQSETDRLGILEYIPPHIVVNEALDIILSRGRMSPFIEISSGQVSLSLLKMIRPELLVDLTALISLSKKSGSRAFHRRQVSFGKTKKKLVTIKVLPFRLADQPKPVYFSIFFEEENLSAMKSIESHKKSELKKSSLDARKEALNDKKNLLLQKEYQQSLIEEFETAQEELTSTNEEMQSTNEELQSSNEELETSKEELQSTNEELTTVNDELDLSRFPLGFDGGLAWFLS